MAKWFYLSEPQVSHLQNGHNNANLIVWLQGLNKLAFAKSRATLDTKATSTALSWDGNSVPWCVQLCSAQPVLLCVTALPGYSQLIISKCNYSFLSSCELLFWGSGEQLEFTGPSYRFGENSCTILFSYVSVSGKHSCRKAGGDRCLLASLLPML